MSRYVVLVWEIFLKAKYVEHFIFIERFDVHSNKIIRTDESLHMGAKFIADVELASRDQCLRVCCETEGCDVFVYEEKVRLKHRRRYISTSMLLSSF